VRLLRWLGGGSEDESPRMGVLSSRAEWHALGIGGSVGFITAYSGGREAAWLFMALAAIAFGVRKAETKHLQHVQSEPYYALVASVIVYLLSVYIILPSIGLSL